jgi:hypothetical protein
MKIDKILPILLAIHATTALAGSATEAQLQTAQAATAAFGKALKTELSKAIQSDGPVAAIAVCNMKAPKIAESVSMDYDMEISRVSLKNRNPLNAPNDWEKQVLQSFESRLAAGENPADISWNETVEMKGAKEFRYMKAIPTAGLCLQCHGTAIAEPVANKLSKLYPGDQATGYSEGEIRGAFVVTETVLTP